MILAGLAYLGCRPAPLFSFFPETQGLPFPAPSGAQAPPVPATGLFKGFGVLPQQAEKQTSGGNAGCLFRAFVGTNALLAK